MNSHIRNLILSLHTGAYLQAGVNRADAYRKSEVDATVCEYSDAILALFRYSWRDIGFRYEGLTAEEKACITPEQFSAFVSLLV